MDYALVKEQGVTFAVVVVKSRILNNPNLRDESLQSFQKYFPGVPLILMAQDTRGKPKYYGRNDIVNFLSKVNYRRLPWKRKQV
ncbi:hypothetical protein ACDX78_23075 [Virgibacillus oceani]